ncbi:hypothetical protein BC827DRAFT_1251260 [Russula dissimulans]|nr:hypothetical protein BC827DRAFT_1251260 [Russula dissimulans]
MYTVNLKNMDRNPSSISYICKGVPQSPSTSCWVQCLPKTIGLLSSTASTMPRCVSWTTESIRTFTNLFRTSVSSRKPCPTAPKQVIQVSKTRCVTRQTLGLGPISIDPPATSWV